MLVVDASVAVRVAAGSSSWTLTSDELIAPSLLWSEVSSAIHAAWWRREIDADRAQVLRTRFAALTIRRVQPRRLLDVAWDLADQLGLAKTYDAEFLALARLEGCRVVTADRRLLALGRRLDLTVAPGEL